jgi:hypothetical protein
MNWEAIGAIGEIAGALAVIATLGYVAIQIRQNTAALNSSSRQALVDNDRYSLIAALENADLLEKLGREEPLSPQDQIRYTSIWVLDLRNRELEYFQYKAGALDEAAWTSYQQTLHYTFGTERDRLWWAKVGRESFDRDFVAMVDEFIADAPLNNLIRDMSSWQ